MLYTLVPIELSGFNPIKWRKSHEDEEPQSQAVWFEEAFQAVVGDARQGIHDHRTQAEPR